MQLDFAQRSALKVGSYAKNKKNAVLRLAEVFQDLGDSCPTLPQKTGQFGPGLDLAGVQQGLLMPSPFHAIRTLLLWFEFGLRNGRNGIPQVKQEIMAPTSSIADIDQLQLQAYRQMTGEERLRIGLGLYDASRGVAHCLRRGKRLRI